MKKYLIFIILFSIFLKILFFGCPIGGDEGEYAHQAYFWMKGINPYKSHFFFMFFGYPLVYLFAFKIFGVNILSIRIFLSFWNAGCVFFIYLIGKKLISEKVGLISSFLYAIYSSLPLVRANVGKETYMLLPICIALYFYLLYKEKFYFLFLSGLFLGFSTIFRQSAIALYGFFLILLLFEKREKIKSIVLFSLAVSFPIILCILYGVSSVGLKNFIYYIFSYRVKIASIFVGTWDFHILRSIRSFFKSGMIFWTIPLILNIKLIEKNFAYYFLVGYIFFAFLSFAINGSWYANYWSLILPSICIILSWEIVKIKEKLHLFMTSTFLTFPIITYIILSLHYGSFCMRFKPQYFLTPKVASFIKKNSTPSDTIYAFLYENAAIYFLSERLSGIPHPSCYRQLFYCPEHIKKFIKHIKSSKRSKYIITYTEEESIKLAKKICDVEKNFFLRVKSWILRNNVPFCKDYPIQISLIKEAFKVIKKYYTKVKVFSLENRKVIVWERKDEFK